MDLKNLYKKNEKFFMFALVGGFGTILNTFLLYLLTVYGNIYFLTSSVIATEAAILSNFFGNHYLTFRKNKDPTPTKKKFLKFQIISVSTVLGTAALLWAFVQILSQDYLIAANFGAIGIMFIVNFILNKKFTWKEGKKVELKENNGKGMLGIFGFIFLIVLTIGFISASYVSISQMGYHPDSTKQVIVYLPEGNLVQMYNSSGSFVEEFNLVNPKNYEGQEVQCQGGMPCKIADFSNFKNMGKYYFKYGNVTSETFVIDKNVYQNHLPVLVEFFDATSQQDSSYHADYNSFQDPLFTTMADGSFIMESHQASLTLMRLGSAYQRNPKIFENSESDLTTYIKKYVEYLKSLQGVEIEHRTDGSGFRLNEHVEPIGVFVPGESDLVGESLQIYSPGNPPSKVKSLEVYSLCGDLAGGEKQECLNYAEEYYKCQSDEPCLNMSYQEDTGIVTGRDGYDVSTGWWYDWACYYDVNLNEGMFNSDYNPCLVFNEESNAENTLRALVGFLEVIPIFEGDDSVYAEEILKRSILTYQYVEENYPGSQNEYAALFGTAGFLLYDYTGNESYLGEAYLLRDNVPDSFNHWELDENEFYWYEYVSHKDAIESKGLVYTINSENPEEYFRGKTFNDYKDEANAISDNGERVLDSFRTGYSYSNSRAMLIAAVFSIKTSELYDSLGKDKEDFWKVISDNQLAWITGMNLVQEGLSTNASEVSYSYIYGIGKNPSAYHSRYLTDTSYSQATNGEVIGGRDTGLQYYNGSDYVYLDGTSEILNYRFGGMGNGINNETQVNRFSEKTFNNGKDYISGWINGVYDSPYEEDVRFNYEDDYNSWTFTETTNEIVATAIELFAYLDAEYNNISRIDRPVFALNNTLPENNNYSLSIVSNPSGAKIYLDGHYLWETTDVTLELEEGNYSVLLEKEGYEDFVREVVLNQDKSIDAVLVPKENNQTNETLFYDLLVDSYPSDAEIFIDGILMDSHTPYETSLEAGIYEIKVSHPDHGMIISRINLQGDRMLNLTLPGYNVEEKGVAYLSVHSSPELAEIFVDNDLVGEVTPHDFEVEEGIKTIRLWKEGYEDYAETINFEAGNNYTINTTLNNKQNNFILGSYPFGADVYLNDEKIGKTPFYSNLTNGRYNLTLKHGGYFDYEDNFKISNNNITLFAYLEEDSSRNKDDEVVVEFESFPIGARVLVNEEDIGVETPNKINLSPGEYNLAFVKDGFDSYAKELTLNEGGKFKISAELIQDTDDVINNSDGNFSLNLVSNPFGAEILINGEITGKITPWEFNLNEGEYSVLLEKEGYENYEKNFSLSGNKTILVNLTEYLNETSNENETNSSKFYSLKINSNPAGAKIYLNGNYTSKTTDANLRLVEGEYNLSLVKDGYKNFTSEIVLDQNKTIHYLLKEDSPNVSIIEDYYASIEKSEEDIADYVLIENETIVFYLNLIEEDNVTWNINGNTRITSGLNHSVEFTPNILFTDNNKSIDIIAKVNGEIIIWDVGVYNLLNPFFTPTSGLEGSVLTVVAQDNIINYDSVKVEILSFESGEEVRSIFALNKTLENNETYWKRFIGNDEFKNGINYLTKIISVDNNVSKEYHLSTQEEIRAFDKSDSSEGNSDDTGDSGGSGGSSGGSGGTSGGEVDEEIDLIYVTIDKDVLNKTGTQTIKLDVRSDASINDVEVVLLNPEGNYVTQNMERVDGSSYYGTWEVKLRNFISGPYELVRVKASNNFNDETFQIDGRKFYVIGDEVSQNEKLMLVYTTLSDDVVDTNPKNVTFKLDARDSKGIESVSVLLANIKNGKREEVVMNLRLVSGDNNYGTWETQFRVDERNTAYSIEEVRLTNGDDEKVYSISDRKVFGGSNLPSSGLGFGITGGVIAGDLFENLTDPNLPAILGFIVVLGIIAFFLVGDGVIRFGKKIVRKFRRG